MALQFADEIGIFLVTRNPQDDTSIFEKIVNEIGSQLNDLGLALSPKKSKIVLFSKKDENYDLQFKINNTAIIPSETARFLGLYFDS